MQVLGVMYLCFWVLIIGSWVGNAYKLTQCDFKGDELKCEVAHAIGLVPILSLVTVWLDTEENKQENKQ